MNFRITLTLFFFSIAEVGFSLAGETEGSTTAETVRERIEEEEKASDMEYVFLAHKPFYILPATHNSSPSSGSLSGLSRADPVEVKLQFSFKVHMIEKFWRERMQLSLGYTNQAFWQLYNVENSRPFRETNHEPELFLTFYPHGRDGIHQLGYLRFGLSHQSNGQNVPESRSWNRIYLEGTANVLATYFSLKLWSRLPETSKEQPLSPKGDDNPGILDYMGIFELRGVRKIGDHTLSTIFRNNLKSQNRGAVEFGWSFPMNSSFHGYLQYFNGYGESLIDYNRPTQRIGLGILMVDWL